MGEKSVFWSLVWQDFKGRKRQSVRISRGWWIAYGCAVALIAIVAATFVSLKMNFNPSFLWVVFIGLIFMYFGLTTGLTAREWKNGTVGWWLTLPVSRRTLAAAKFTASIALGSVVCLAIYCVIALFGLYVMALSGDFTAASVGSFLLIGIEMSVLVICSSPFVAASGLLFYVLVQSRIKPALPLLWIGFIGLCNLFFAYDNKPKFLQMGPNGVPDAIVASTSTWYPILGSWVVAALLVWLATYLLDRQLAM